MFYPNDFCKVNRFKRVACPKNKDLYARVGSRVPNAPSGFDADFNTSKLDSLSQAQKLAESSVYEQELKASQMPLDTDTSEAKPQP